MESMNRLRFRGSRLATFFAMYAFAPPENLDDVSRRRIADALEQLMADEFALATTTRDYHWTVTGPHFRSSYELFDDQFRQLNEWMEKVAETARALGIRLRTGWNELAPRPSFSPTSGHVLNTATMMSSLIAMHRGIAERFQADSGEHSVAEVHPLVRQLASELVEYHETTAWLLSELLEDRERAQA